MLSFALFLSKLLDTTGSYHYPPVAKRELKTRRPSARSSAVVLKNTKPSRPKSREQRTFFQLHDIPSLPRSLKLTPMRLRGDDERARMTETEGKMDEEGYRHEY